MKKYEFKNYVTHRSAEVHVDVPGYGLPQSRRCIRED